LQGGSRDDALDGLRGIAVALIVWHHLYAPFLPPVRDSWLGVLRAATNLAWCGVDLFFVLSGFFIGGILIDHRGSPRLARVFYLRRSLRILPLYYLTLVTLFALIAIGAPHGYRSFPAEIYLLFLTNFALASSPGWDWIPLSVLWSLAVEEQFYLSAPWVARAISAHLLPLFLGFLVVGALLARIVAIRFFDARELAVHVLMPFRMDCLALGFLVAWGMRTPRAEPVFGHLGRWWKTYGAFALLVLAGLSLLRPSEGSVMLAYGGYTLLGTAFATVVAIIARVRPPALTRWLTSRALICLGRYSYFIYLWHAIIGLYVIRFLAGDNMVLDTPAEFAAVVAGTVATFAAAALSWRWFEAPLIKMGRRWSYG
jgi:peptidoglycan/LPS O-acetylase OafA/YrhL